MTGFDPVRVIEVLLSDSGLAMNREIAQHERWGRQQIHERADALAARTIRLWPVHHSKAYPKTNYPPGR